MVALHARDIAVGDERTAASGLAEAWRALEIRLARVLEPAPVGTGRGELQQVSDLVCLEQCASQDRSLGARGNVLAWVYWYGDTAARIIAVT